MQRASPSVPSPCPACDATDWIRWRAVGGLDGRPHTYVRCRTCSLVALATAVPGLADTWYDEGYFRDGGSRGGYADYEADSHAHRRNARERLNRLAASIDRPGTLVEIGCATGLFLDEAVAAGWSVSGVEISSWAADRARSRGHRVVASFADLGAEAGSVDAIALFQALEHLDDPSAALAECARLLRPGGVLVCETWDADSRVARYTGRFWQQLSAPSVLWAFTRRSATALLARHGLLLAQWETTPKVVSLAWAGGIVAGRLGVSPAVARADWLRRTTVRYRGDDLVTFVAVRDDG